MSIVFGSPEAKAILERDKALLAFVGDTDLDAARGDLAEKIKRALAHVEYCRNELREAKTELKELEEFQRKIDAP